MFPEMRRKRQQLEEERCIEILKHGTYGVLALNGADGYPYTVPINYVYANGKLYFHSAREGHKITALKADPKASFCVVSKDDIMPTELTTYFESVVVFGKVHIIESDAEKKAAILALSEKLDPACPKDKSEKEIQTLWKVLCMLEIDIEHMTGKQAKELMK